MQKTKPRRLIRYIVVYGESPFAKDKIFKNKIVAKAFAQSVKGFICDITV